MRACPGGVEEASVRKNEKEGKKRSRRGEKEEKKKSRIKENETARADFVIAPRRPINFDRSIARYNYNIYINLYIIYAYD